MGSTELYRWAGAFPDDAFMHGRGYVDVNAAANLSLHRGFDLSASFSALAQVQAALGGGEAALALTGEVRAEAALALTAQLPLDLFKAPGAGLVLLFHAGGSISASVALTASLGIGDLVSRLHPRFPAPWGGMLDLVEQEFDISVGLWGRVEGALEVQGHAILAGYLLGGEDALSPGFSASVGFSAGFEFGTGLSCVVNVGFQQPDQLVARLGERLAGIAADAIDRHAATVQDQAARDAEMAAGALSRLLIPMGLEAAYHVGAATVAEGDRRSSAVTAIGNQLLHQGQAAVLRAAIQYAGQELGKLFDSTLLVDAVLMLEDPHSILGPLQDVGKTIVDLAATDTSSPTELIPAVEALIVAAETVVSTPLFNGDRVDTVRHALAVVWSAGKLLEAIAGAAATPTAVHQAAFAATPSPLPAAAAFASQIRHVGTVPTLGEIVAFLAGEVWDAAVASVPWLTHISTWLETALGGSKMRVLEKLFTEFLPPASGTVEAIVADLAPVIAQATEQVRSHALAPLIAASEGDTVLCDLLNDVVDPMLDALPLVALAGLELLGQGDEAATRVREALAAVTFQAVGKFVLDITSELVEDALGQEAAIFEAAGADIAANGAESATYHRLSTLGLGGVLTVAEAQRLMVICGTALSATDASMRTTMPLLSGESGAGVGAPAQRAARLAQIMHDDLPPIGTDLAHDVTVVAAAGAALAEQIVPPFVDFCGAWLGRRIDDMAQDAGKVAGEVITWIKGQLADLEHEGDALKADIDKWVTAAERELAGIAEEVANILAALKAETAVIFADVQARGDQLIEEIVPDIFDWRRQAKDLLTAAINALTKLTEAILSLAENAARAASDALYAAAGSGQISSDQVHGHVRSTIYLCSTTSVASGVTVAGVTFPVTVSAADVAGAAWTRAAGSPAYNASVDRGVAHAQAAAQAQAQKANSQVVLERVVTAAQSYAAADNLVPGVPLSVKIESPGPGANPGRARLQVRLQGANRTFVESTLGVAQRVVIRLNDTAVAFDGSCWWVDFDDLVLAAQVVPQPQPAAAIAAALAADPSAGGASKVVESVTVLSEGDGGTSVVRHVQFTGTKPARVTSLRPPDGTTTSRTGESLAGLGTAPLAAGPGALKDTLAARDGANVDVVEEPARPRPTIPQTTPVSRSTPPNGGTVIVEWPNTPLWIPQLTQLPVLHGRLGLNTLQVAVYDGAGRVATDATTFYVGDADVALRERIAVDAYYRWINRGRVPGFPELDWLAAEAETRRAMVAEAAFHNWLNRHTEPGREVEDWLRAEQTIALREMSR